MGINITNTGAGYALKSDPRVNAQKITDFSKMPRPANADKFVLNLPVSETVYTRKEFVNDEKTAENTACCYTYMERTLTFADGSTISGFTKTAAFAINLDKVPRDFGSSGTDMRDIGHAVEETWERKERSLEQSSISGSLSGAFTENGRTFGGSLGFAAQSTAYKYSSVSNTVGSVSLKDGSEGNYTENVTVSRELYNKCAVMLAEAFGEKSDALVLSEKDFSEIFGKEDINGGKSSDKLAEKLEKLEKQRGLLKAFMDKHLNAVKKKDPLSESLKAFSDAYALLGKCSYAEISSVIERMFRSEYSGNLR